MPSRLILLLPPWEVLERQGDADLLGTARARGDALASGLAGLRAQQLRVFDVVPKPPAWAAITRRTDCGDASEYQWLRADPAHVQVEAGGLRLLAFGEALALETADSEALATSLRPSFHDLGMVFSAPNPWRWYVQLARGRPMPRFLDPEDALGASGTPLPAGETAGREWSRLLNETQMVLHDHPVNRDRARGGLLTVNSLWLWGAGELPLKVASGANAYVGSDAELRALAQVARVAALPSLGAAIVAKHASVVLDARRGPRSEVLREAIAEHAAGRFEILRLDSEDGRLVEYKRWHRFRFWRR
ncbi:MAG: phosphoglycerate mutase [Lysobacterales bacterium]